MFHAKIAELYAEIAKTCIAILSLATNPNQDLNLHALWRVSLCALGAPLHSPREPSHSRYKLGSSLVRESRWGFHTAVWTPLSIMATYPGFTLGLLTCSAELKEKYLKHP